MPKRQSVTGRRLCSGILTDRKFTLGGVTERSAKDYDYASETSEADEGEADVRAREEVPGFHLFFVTEVSVARQGAGGQVWETELCVSIQIGYHFFQQLNVVSNLAQNHVAAPTQQFSNLTRGVAVVNTEFFPPAISLLTANGTQTVLFFKHLGVIAQTNAVVSHEVIVSGALRVVLMSCLYSGFITLLARRVPDHCLLVADIKLGGKFHLTAGHAGAIKV